MGQFDPYFPFTADEHFNIDGLRRAATNSGAGGPFPAGGGFNSVGQYLPNESSVAGTLRGAEVLRGLRDWPQRNRIPSREVGNSAAIRLFIGYAPLDAPDALGARQVLESTLGEAYEAFESIPFSDDYGNLEDHGRFELRWPSTTYSVPRTFHTCMGIRCVQPCEPSLTSYFTVQNSQIALAQHQQLMRRQAQLQAHAQAQAAQAQAAAGGMIGMQHGGMQMHQFQQSNPGMHPGAPGVQLTPHLMQQQMQLQIQRQQQQQAAQQNHQAQMQQQLAMQQANSQQSNPGQPGPPNQQGQQQHPQMRPPSRMANPHEQNQGAQQHHPPQGPQGQPPPQTPQQVQQHNPQQPPMNPQQVQMQRLALLRQQQIQAHRVQQVQAQVHAQAQQQQQRPGGAFILRINQIADHLGNFDQQSGLDMAAWTEFVEKHFHPDARLIHIFVEQDRSRTFEVLRSSIARYFWTYFQSGAQSLRLHTEQAAEIPMAGRMQVRCQRAILTISFSSGARLEMAGSLNAMFAPSSDVIECLEIQQVSDEEIISRTEIKNVLDNFSPITSPKMTKNKLSKTQQKLQQQRSDGLTLEHFPKVPRGQLGTTSRVQQFLEVDYQT